MKKVIMMLLGLAFAGAVWADPSVVIQKPAEGEFLGFVSAFEGFSLPLQLGASDADFNNPDGFAVKVTSGEYTLYDKSDILFRKEYPTDLEINEGLHYDPENLIQTATITVKTPDGRVTTRTFTFGLLPDGGVCVHDLDEVNDAIKTAKEEEWWDLVFVKTNDFPIASGKKIALPTLEEESKIYFAGDGKLDVSSIVPTFGTPYDVVTNFTTNNFVEVLEEWEYDEELGKWVDVTNVYTTVEKQLAQFSTTSDVAKLVFDAKRKTISLIGRGESEDYPWILDASTNVTAWVDANKKLVIDNGLLANSYDIDLVVMTNDFAKCKYTAPANALVKVVNGSSTKTVTSAGWVGANGAYATLGDALKAGEAKIVPGYAVSYDANGAAGVMSNDVFAVNRQVTLKANAFSAVGYDFAGWATNGVDEVVYADAATVKDLAPVDGSATLTAQWTETGVSINDFVVLTNTLVAATNQAASLPVKITLSGEIAVPQDGVITVNASPAITFAGEAMLDVSAVVPTFGTPTVVGEGFTSTNAPALFDTKGVSKLVYEDGTVSVVARGETEDFPWLLDAATNVTAWVESSNLVINNGLTAESYEIDLVALTNNVATYSYTPASPLNAVVKVGEADYKTPKCWIGESASYTTLGAALEAGETMVLPGYEVVYEANGVAGSMTNSYFAAATEATLTANAFSAVGYDFAGWATNGVDEVVYADAATVKDLAPVDGSATLTAQWNVNSNGVTVTSFEALTNAIATAGLQGANLPITIGFASSVTIPEDATLPTLPTGTGYDGLKYVAEEEGGSNLWVEDGVLYGDVLRGEVPVDALVLMQHAMGGAVTEFKALSEGEDSTIVTNDVVMLLGDNRQAYFNDTDSVDQMIADILAADPRPTTVKLYDVKSYWVSYDGGGAAGEMATDMFIPDVTTNLTANAFSAVGNAFVGWSTNDTDVIYADKADGANFTNPGATLELTALWTKVETVPANYGALTNMIAQMTLPVTFTLTNDLPLAVGETVILPEGKEISFAGEGQFDVSAIVPQFGAPVVVGEGFADESALALFNTKDVSKLVFEDGEVSIAARGETEDFPWILDAEANVTAWVDPSLTNLAAVVIANGPAAESAIDLVALTNNLEVYGYTPEVTPLNALVKVVEAGETSYQIPTGWVGAEGTYATLEAALEAGETAVVPNFAVEEIPAVIAENAAGADGNVYTAVVVNEPGEMTNAIRAVAAEGLLALATNELANVRLIVAAEAAADVAAEEAKIAAAITNDISAVAGLVVDYVDFSVLFDDVPQTTLTDAIGICIPRTLNPQHDYAVARVHAGVAEALPVGAANAVEGEYVEFATDGLVVHAKKFSLYAIGEITPFTTVTVPTGLEGYSYVVSNLTAGVEMTIDSTVDGGVTYKLPVDAKVSITCVPEKGYVVDGEATYVIESVTKETTLVDVKLPAAREDDLLYPSGDGDRFVSAMKSTETFYGVLFGTNGMEGLVTLKMTRPNRRTGLFYIRATVKTLVDKASYTFQAKKVAVPETGVLTIELVGKSKQSSNHRLVVVLDGDSLTGAFDDWAIDGARDVFGIKNHPKRTALEPLVGTWTGILAGEDEKTVGAFFSVKITKTARAAVKVVAADGKAMPCSTKVEIGADGRGVVPVMVSRLSGGVRTSIGFRILFRQTDEGIVAKAVNVTPVRRWSKKTGLTTVSTLAFVGAEKLTVTAKQFRTDYVLKLAPTYAEVLGDPAGETLKLDAYGRITGTIMWKVPYLDVHGHERIKSVSGKVTGIMVGDTGIGTVAVKLPTGERVAIDLELQKE